MKIDAHQHFWKFNPSRDTWIDATMLVLQKDFLPPNLEPLLSSNGFDGCIAIQADTSLEESQFLLELSDSYSFIKAVVGWVDLTDSKVEESLKIFSQHTKFKGVRHIVQAESDGFMLQDNFLNGISLLEKYNLTYDILIYSHQIKEAIELVKKFPNQKFIIDHIAKPNIKNKQIVTWKEDITHLSTFENVYCKLSGLVTETNWNTWSPEEFTPYLEVLFQVFGTERLLFGSDWPVCLLASKYDQVVALIETYIKTYSPQQREAIMGLNALKFYNI